MFWSLGDLGGSTRDTEVLKGLGFRVEVLFLAGSSF